MKNTYTILLMSSNQDSVRQLSIKRWFALCLGLILCLLFVWIISMATSGVKYGLRYKAELQGEVASREELENTIKQYQRELQGIHKELEGVRKMAKMVRRVLGINSEQGILGQGGGDASTQEVNDAELTSSIIEALPASTSITTDSTDGSLINRIIEIKREFTPIYEHVKNNQKTELARPWILPILAPMEEETPSYWFSSGFGRRSHPLTGRPQFHNGLDIAAPTGTPVIATADGVIEEIRKDPSLGNMIQIAHKDSQMRTLYGHLKNYADGLQVGTEIKRREVIGYVGNSGRSTGTHLHYGIHADGKWQNPKNYILDHSPH